MSERQIIGIGETLIYWDSEAQIFVASVELTAPCLHSMGYAATHPVCAQGATMAEARAALDSAVCLTIKTWPPRKP